MTPPRAAKGSLELTLRRELVDDIDRSIRAAGDTSEKKAATGENTAAVPEPSTLILMILAAVGWSLRRHRAE